MNKKIQLIPVMLCFFAMGFVDLVGIASNYVQSDLGLSDAAANIFPSLVFFWFLIFSVPTGMLMNRIGRKNTVLLSLVVTVVSLLLPIFGESYGLMLVSFSLLGIGNALMQTSLNPLITNIIKGDRLASTMTFGGSSASGSRYITLEGSAKTTCDAEIVNTSGMTINSMTVRVGGNTMTFRSLGLGGSEALVIDHVDGLVRIRIRNGSSYRSAMAARTGANDFMSPPGSQYCAYSADRAVRMTVSWRSRYL